MTHNGMKSNGINNDGAKDNWPRLILGHIVATPGALDLLDAHRPENPGGLGAELLARHASGDWGELCEDDAQANRDALKVGLRVFSCYSLTQTDGQTAKLWIITEADRSATTLLPDEY